MRGRGAWLLVTLALAPAVGRAQGYRTLWPGIEYAHRTPGSPPQDVHIVRIDLRDERVGVRATARADRGLTVSSFAARYGANVAINGDFREGHASEPFAPSGLAMADGEAWAEDNENESFLAFGADNRAEHQRDNHRVASRELPDWYQQALGGRPLLVWEGRNVAPADCPRSLDLCSGRHPRTATGLSRDGRTLFLVVVDGRRPGATGMTTLELGRFMLDLGAHSALNHDGGGSSDLWLRGRGVVNRPSDGAERVLTNHLAVVWRSPRCTGNVRGYVREGSLMDAMAGLRGATVTFPFGRSGRSRADGYFEVPGVDCDLVTMHASADGFVPRMRAVAVNPLSWSSASIALDRVGRDASADATADAPDPVSTLDAPRTTEDDASTGDFDAEPKPLDADPPAPAADAAPETTSPSADAPPEPAGGPEHSGCRCGVHAAGPSGGLALVLPGLLGRARRRKKYQ